MALFGNLLLGWRKMNAKGFLDAWQSQTVYGSGKGIELIKSYEFLPMHIDLYWTVRELHSKNEARHLKPVDIYHRVSYKDYKKVIKEVESEEWPRTIAHFEMELEKLSVK